MERMAYTWLKDKLGERPANIIVALTYAVLILLVLYFLPLVEGNFRYMNW